MPFKQKITSIGIVCILAGSIWLYFQGHKDNNFINGVFCTTIIIGWLVLMFALAGKCVLDEREIKFNANKLQWFKRKVTDAIIYLILAGVILGNILFVENLMRKRVDNILIKKATQITFAEVIKIENRYSRLGWKFYAVIAYRTISKTVKQAVYNYRGKYTIGQTLRIKYSIDYPEMFTII